MNTTNTRRERVAKAIAPSAFAANPKDWGMIMHYDALMQNAMHQADAVLAALADDLLPELPEAIGTKIVQHYELWPNDTDQGVWGFYVEGRDDEALAEGRDAKALAEGHGPTPAAAIRNALEGATGE